MTDLNKEFDVATWSGDHRDAPYIIVAEDREGGQDIRIHDLTVRLPDEKKTELVKNLDLTIPKGSRVVLTGESGSGKTVTAKAILNQWYHGTGLVVMPAGARTMMMSQQAYFPNTTIRGILNNAPEDKVKFDDSELAAALHAVGHDKLIQHIPGQQTKILIDDLLSWMEEFVNISAVDAEALQGILSEKAADIVGQQFNVVQFVPKEQRDYLIQQLQKTLSAADADKIAAAVIDRVDIELAKPLLNHLLKNAEQAASVINERWVPLSPSKLTYLSHVVEKSFAKRVAAYMKNTDTDDQSRPIRINKAQADYVVKAAALKLKEELSSGVSRNFLVQAFNAVTWPVSLQTVRSKGSRVAEYLMQSLDVFMDKQVLTGEKLTLSGGEKQKLMIASVLLHKPDILILDEITAALDRDTGERLYREMLEQIPKDTTVISIAHNEHIVKYHTHHAHLAGKTITMTALNPPNPSTGPGPSAPKP